MTSASQLCASFLLILVLSANAVSQKAETKVVPRTGTGFQYTSFQVPGSSSTVASGVNNLGDIVGTFVSDGVQSGFLYTGGTFQTIACPNSGSTIAQGINDAGVVVGWCSESGSVVGFIYQNGSYRFVAYPKAKQTVLIGINNEGAIVGVLEKVKTRQLGFLYSNGTFTLIGGKNGSLSGLNNLGMIAGSGCSAPCDTDYGVIYEMKKGRWRVKETVNYPGATSTGLNGIDDNGDLAGAWGPTPNGQNEGFVYIKNTNTFFGFDIENSADIEAEGINNSGEIVGFYTVGTTFYGFYGYVSQ
jgi:hypothetical protein